MNKESSSVEHQLNRLEKISDRISYLIKNNDYEKIDHLDKIRKKIIGDINEKNHVFTDSNKNTILKLVSKNQKIISVFKKNNSKTLNKILHSKKCSEAYLASY